MTFSLIDHVMYYGRRRLNIEADHQTMIFFVQRRNINLSSDSNQKEIVNLVEIGDFICVRTTGPEIIDQPYTNRSI